MEIEATVQAQNTLGPYKLIFFRTPQVGWSFSLAQEWGLSWCGSLHGFRSALHTA